MTTISALPTAPSRADPSTFASRADAWVAALPTFASETNAVAGEVNAAAAAASASASAASTSAGTASSASATAAAAARPAEDPA